MNTTVSDFIQVKLPSSRGSPIGEVLLLTITCGDGGWEWLIRVKPQPWQSILRPHMPRCQASRAKADPSLPVLAAVVAPMCRAS